VKIPDLIVALREIFEVFGTILDVVAKKSLKRRGQAFIVYDNVDSAQEAMADLQGFELFDKPMQLQYAKSKSDASIKAEGNEEELEARKKERAARKDKEQAAEDEAQKKRKAEDEDDDAAPVAKKVAKGAAPAGQVPDEYLPPNKILFVRDVPDDYDMDNLKVIFGRFVGFKEVRTVPGRKGLAFIEYEAEEGAVQAKERTSGMTLGAAATPIRVTYQRQ